MIAPTDDSTDGPQPAVCRAGPGRVSRRQFSGPLPAAAGQHPAAVASTRSVPVCVLSWKVFSMPDGQPRPTTWWEWFTFIGIFGLCFFLLALLRGVFLVAARAIREDQDKARIAAILARREAKARLQRATAGSSKKTAPTKQPPGPRGQQPTKQGKSKAAKKVD